MRRRYNRHGFQNFGGRKAGQVGLITEHHVNCLKWLDTAIKKAESEGLEVYTSVFDVAFQPVGNVIRYELRQFGYLHEEAVEGQDYKRMLLTKKAVHIVNNLDKLKKLGKGTLLPE